MTGVCTYDDVAFSLRYHVEHPANTFMSTLDDVVNHTAHYDALWHFLGAAKPPRADAVHLRGWNCGENKTACR